MGQLPAPGPARSELQLMPRHGWRSLGVALAAGLGFGAWMALADATIFASTVPEVQHRMVGLLGSGQRVVMGARGALIDELLLRGMAMTMLVWAAIAVSGRRGAGVYWLAVLVTALAVYPLKDFLYFAGLDWSGLTVLREITLHGSAGVLWGWLYWRHGWLAGLTGHVAAHVALQPLLSMG